ncbi:MAG TPA: DegV family protein [Anaerolineales bacterium]|jgi:DegV family protein with EDD domain|nr:DegV family protein [Anaerolineales bacterium]
MTIRIVTDSTCDLPDSVISRYKIPVLPLYLNFGHESYLDGVELSRQDFYRKLVKSEAVVSTAAPAPDMFRRAYEKLAAEGATQVLSIHVSGSLSGILGVAKLAAQETTAVPVHVFDSRQLSLGTGFLVEAAAKSASEGRSLEKILAELAEQISRTHVFAALDTLEFLRRSGRMHGLVAGLGSVLQIKPILRMYDGNASSERVRTRGKAIDRLVGILKELAPLERAAIVHANAVERAQALQEQTKHLLPVGEIPLVDITPVIGAHVGPGAVGFACVRTRNA